MLFQKFNVGLLTFFVLLNSFLLFLLEIYLGKYFLPYFGGSASVWNICLAFFTTFLFLAYLYAHLISKLNIKYVLYAHLFFGAISLAAGLYGYYFLNWKTPFTIIIPDGVFSNPEVELIKFLIYSCSLIFIFLGSTTIVAQKFYYHINNKEPYHLYAISNLGSFLGLFSFPFIFERYFTINEIGFAFTGLVLLSLLAYAIIIVLNIKTLTHQIKKEPEQLLLDTKKIPLKKVLSWLGISFVANGLLVAFTNYISQEISPFPMIWALILASYLLSFITGFRNINNFKLKALSIIGILLLNVSINFRGTLSFLVLIFLFLIIMFTLLNNKLYTLRPNPKYLSSFYLYTVLGGALGALSVSLLPPLLFNDFYEIPLTVAAALLILPKTLFAKTKIFLNSSTIKKILINYFYIIIIINTFILLPQPFTQTKSDLSVRNFYGLLKVKELNGTKTLINGSTVHGVEEIGKTQPTSYYWKGTGIGKTIEYMQTQNPSLNIAVVGLGIGTISAYCRDNDNIFYYEINSADIKIAQDEFTFLHTCKNSKIYEGDARIILKNQKTEIENNKFDLIIIDAFTGDAIPYHLITVEAVSLYKSLIKENGVLAFHISNKYLNLQPVIEGISAENKMNYLLTQNNAEIGNENINLRTIWAISTVENKLLDFLKNEENELEFNILKPVEKKIIWTDNHNSLLNVFDLN